MDVLWDRDRALKIFGAGTDIINKGLQSIKDKCNADRLKQFTIEITSLPELEYERGRVYYYHSLRGFGFIKY